MTPDLEIDLRARLGTFRLDVRLVVERGPVALVGPNGAGKTTLLRALAGAFAPIEGVVRVRGETLVDTARGVCRPPEARRVGYLPQGHALFEHLSVADNVAYGLRGAPAERRARAEALLAAVELGHLADRRARGLSGGERQRVALARALATEPTLLLLDEPTSALDLTARPRTRELLTGHLRDPSRCAVVVTHDARDLAAWKPTIALMEGGRVVARADGHPFLRELLALPGAP